MKKIAITGITRTHGAPTDFAAYKQATKKHYAIIHLALTREVGFRNELMNLDDFQMTYNTYKVAVENRIPKIIIASSIHADNYSKWQLTQKQMNPYSLPYPDSPYGAVKVYGETLGRFYTQKHKIETVCVRFGGVTPDDGMKKHEKGYEQVYLSHNDCISLIQKILNTQVCAGKYEILYAVSNNKNRIHDTSNSYGWTPRDGM